MESIVGLVRRKSRFTKTGIRIRSNKLRFTHSFFINLDQNQAVQFTDSGPIELELYPLLLRLLRHSSATNDNGPAWNGQSWNSIVGGYGAAALGIFLTIGTSDSRRLFLLMNG